MEWYDFVVTKEDFTGIENAQLVNADNIKAIASELVPECHINFEMIFTDKRCKKFRHYMPCNKTTAERSYKLNNLYHKEGSNVRVYISKRFDLI